MYDLVKVEVEIKYLYDDEEDFLSDVKEQYEAFVQSKYDSLGCYKENEGICLENDTRTIRLTFANSSIMNVSNSEWGRIMFSNRQNREATSLFEKTKPLR